MIELDPRRVERFRQRHGLCLREEQRPIWWATLGWLVVPLPNFKWRREAIAQHDVHHLVTGYGLSMSGELRVAAWEWGVRCYTNPWARALCAGLFGLGLVLQPRVTWAAFERGCRERTSYFEMLKQQLAA